MIALLAAGGLSLAFTLFLTPLFIRLFRRLEWGQFIREDGPQSHHLKRGTPTMGGIVFILGALFGYFAGTWIGRETPTVTGMLVLLMFVGLGLVGFVDDFLKTHRKQSLGLGGWAKIAGQCIVAVVFAVLALNFPNADGVTPASSHVSFIRDLPLDLMFAGAAVGIVLYTAWITILTVSASNAVNVTDGLDGLASGASIFSIGAFILIGFWQFNQRCGGIGLNPADEYRCYEVRDPLDIAIVATAIVGAVLGFLWWNTNPAKIIMGDTGSLALGGALTALAVVSRTELLLIVLGGLFVIETGSVIVQRTYFKATKGRRIFLMSPIHHHFELKGWAEVTIVVRFWIISGLFVAVGIGAFYFEWLSQ
ncbi:phospho-N-acetylmuramoyl-pentapeptide-transferase [Agromyces seonyuensis]|uniref:Phospho-N-acetylmuramoyl-pentapeptide-transferase n=1 Tax=Agromyces seonyuensis TaxID=2662446 RepID=A0A6I4P1P1_9MICO|nr:phospho-N-acetylmuramoyl-pentapeptide-transferase [Agromyces seonyuensis]